VSDVSPPQAEKARGSRGLKYALIASLALNLLIVGAVAGTMFYGFKHPAPRFGQGAREDFGLYGLTHRLPEDRRKELRKQLRQDRKDFRPLVDEIATARREAADKLAAEPFDKAALEAAIANVASKEQALRQAAVNVFLGHAERLTPDERKTLAEWWRKRSERFQQRRKVKEEAKDAAAEAAKKE
jgi:uncharacterized membrane protein